METLITSVSIIILLGLIVVPIFVFVGIKKWNRLKFDFILYLISGIIISAGTMLIFAWWMDYSDTLLLKHFNGYVFNDDIGSYQVSYDGVLPENIDRVKALENSIMGVGWPLKAFFGFILYCPYILIVYPIGRLFKKSS